MSKSEADFQLLKSDYQKEIEEYKEKIFIQSQQCNKDRKYHSGNKYLMFCRRNPEKI